MKNNPLNKILREPLVHFLVIGVGLFFVFELIREPAPDRTNRIVVDAGQVEQLSAQFKRTWMRTPTKAELEGLIESHIRDEVYYREALAMGLDQNDPMIRLRMRQKLEFILEDFSNTEDPDEQVLSLYLEKNVDRFQIKPQLSFRQVYLNPDKHGDLQKDAARILEELSGGARPEKLGDPSMVASAFDLSPQDVIARFFGGSFAEELVGLTPGQWKGPLYSALGAHLVLITEFRAGRTPELAEIRSQVERDYLAQRRRELKDAAYQKLREGYEVVIEQGMLPGSNSGKAVAAERAEEVHR